MPASRSRNRAAALAADAPLVGAGLNNFPFVFHCCYQGFIMDDRAWMVAEHAHNLYLQAMADGGLGGLLATVALLAMAGVWWARARRTPAADPGEDGLCAAALAGIAAFGGFNLIDTMTFGAKGAPVAWLLLGLLAGHPANRIGAAAAPLRRAARVLRLALPAAVLLAALPAAAWLAATPLVQDAQTMLAVRRAVVAVRPIGPVPANAPALPPPPAALTAALAGARAARPADPRLLYAQGLLAYQYADYDQAATSLDRLRALGAATPPALYYLGWAQLRLGHTAQAATAWQQTGAFEVLLAGGQALAAKDPAAARATLRAADAAAPGHLNPPPRARPPGRPDRRLGCRRARLRRARSPLPRPRRALPRRGRPRHSTQAARRRRRRATPRRRRRAQPAWLVAWRLSQADQAAGRPADALQDARAAVAAAPANGTVQDWLAGLYAAAGDDAAAARQEEQAARAPDAPWPWLGHLRAAQAWRRAGDPARAQAEARAAVAAAEQHNAPAHDRAQAYLLLGDILHATGDPAASAAYAAARRLDPTDPQVQQHAP